MKFSRQPPSANDHGGRVKSAKSLFIGQTQRRGVKLREKLFLRRLLLLLLAIFFRGEVRSYYFS